MRTYGVCCEKAMCNSPMCQSTAWLDKLRDMLYHTAHRLLLRPSSFAANLESFYVTNTKKYMLDMLYDTTCFF